MQEDDPELRTRPVNGDPHGLPVFLRNHRIGIIVRSPDRDPLRNAAHSVILQELPLQLGIVLSAHILTKFKTDSPTSSHNLYQ